MPVEADDWAPVRADYGHTLVGLWEVLMSDSEVCTLWATTLEDHVALGKAYDRAWGFDVGEEGDRRLVLWDEERARRTTDWRADDDDSGTLAVPGEGVVPARRPDDLDAGDLEED